MASDISPRKTAILAGIGYLIIFVTAIFANFFVIEKIGDTVPNLMLFRIAIVCFMVTAIIDALLAWLLYLLLKDDQHLSLLAAWMRLIHAAIMAMGLQHLLSAINVEIVTPYMEAFNYTWLIGLVFFGVHLLLLGYLVFKRHTKTIGVLLAIAGLGYLIDSLGQFLNYPTSLSMFVVVIPGVVGEFAFAIWLLVKGGKAN